MKQTIVLLSYGTVSSDAYKNSIGRLAEELETQLQLPVRDMICGTAAVKNHPEQSMETVFHRLRDENAKELLVLPTFLTSGPHFQRIQAQIEAYEAQDWFHIQFEKPVLERDDLKGQLPAILIESLRLSPAEPILLVGHGTESATDLRYSELEADLHRAGYENVRLALLHGTPSLEDVTDGWSTGAMIRVHPLLISAGKHGKKDIAGQQNSVKSWLIELGFHVNLQVCGLCESATFRQRVFINYCKTEMNKKG